MIKVENVTAQELRYPVVRQLITENSYCGEVVLFTSSHIGIVIQSNSHHRMGTYAENWIHAYNTNVWKPVIVTITD